VIGEMAGSHGVKRPGGSALNAGQVGSQRSAEFIVHGYGSNVTSEDSVDSEVEAIIDSIKELDGEQVTLSPADVISQIQERMTAFGGHIRKIDNAKKAIAEAVELLHSIESKGLLVNDKSELIQAVQARHLSLASIATLKAIIELLNAGSGSRGSHLVLSDDGLEIHPDIKDPDTGETLKFKPENEDLRKSIIRIMFDSSSEDLFKHQSVPVRKAPRDRKAFEPAWSDYREGNIYQD
jgi:hypothetical protein